ncbi:hypothetical protein [Alicyclobacillus kakegawensis]|nr:hypothetical protein [Alicyclobacillus kakegawensis]
MLPIRPCEPLGAGLHEAGNNHADDDGARKLITAEQFVQSDLANS